jgi:hypothetical protein
MNSNNNDPNTIEKCKKVMMSRQLIPMFSIKDNIIDAVNVIPWFILSIIILMIILI